MSSVTRLLTGVAAAALSTFVFASSAAAQSFSVINTADSGPGSLRAAIVGANAATSCPCTINFTIRGTPNDPSGAHRISLLTELPAVQQSTQVDASSQTGFGDTNPNGPEIILDGALTPAGTRGLVFSNPGTSNRARAMVIQGFPSHGLEFNGGAFTVEQMYIGTNAAATAAVPNGGDGIRVTAGAAGVPSLIGNFGSNVISGNGGSGVTIEGGSVILQRGNHIGTNAAGTAAIPNAQHGVAITGGVVTVGGGAGLGGNQIGGNGGAGVYVGPAALDVVIQANTIGTDGFGAVLGNGGDGVWIDGASNVDVGAGISNEIAFNGGKGVLVTGGAGNIITGNSIHSNGGLGIDLGGDGVTPNDPSPDADAGPNNLQNYPVITATYFDAALFATVVDGYLEAAPSITYQIDLYSSPAADASGYGEAEMFQTQALATTDAVGRADFSIQIVDIDLTGQFITATASVPVILAAPIVPNAIATGDTSEISAAVIVNNPPVAAPDSAGTLEDTPVTIPVVANDTDADGDTLTITGFLELPLNGTITFTPTDVTYTPNANFNGTDSFSYTITDGKGGTSSATVTITVAPVNDAPVAVDDTAATPQNTTLTVPAPGVLANDTDIDSAPLTAVLVSGPASGTLTLNPDGSFTFVPASGFVGFVTFTYHAFDGSLPSNTATVKIDVFSTNSAPVAVDDTASTGSGVAVTIDVAANDSDADGDTLVVTLGTPPANGTASCSATACTYQSNAGFNGTDTFTYVVSDGKGATATATVTVNVVPCPAAPVQLLPADDANDVPLNGALTWSGSGAESFVVYFGPAGSGCDSLYSYTSRNGIPYLNAPAGETWEWRVEAINDGCPVVTSACRTLTFGCAPPQLQTPNNGAIGLGTSVTFSWTAVAGASSYDLYLGVGGAAPSLVATIAEHSAVRELADGQYEWYVVARGSPCGDLQSATSNFRVGVACDVVSTPIAAIPGEVNTGENYTLKWQGPTGVSYEVQEALEPTFSEPRTLTTDAFEMSFAHPAAVPTGYYYRVRAICAATPGAWSQTVRIAVIPLPDPSKPPVLNTQVGNRTPIESRVHVPHPEESGPWTFVAETDRPWLTITPSAGPVPAGGIDLLLTTDPSTLDAGAHYGTIIITFTNGTARLSANESKKTTTIPVSISMVTPVTAQPKGAATPGTMIIPAVAHAPGANSQWRSDVRMFNSLSSVMSYQLTFTPTATNGTVIGKRTIFQVKPNATIALDDLVKQWFGIGSLGESGGGVLEIRPLSATGNTLNLSTIVSSRTYNVTATGTFGQFIPAIPFAEFIGKADATIAPVISLQQVSQNGRYRTNLGLVEGSGQPATVSISVFSSTGTKLGTYEVALQPAEHRQLDAFLADKGIELSDGRIEIAVTAGTGKVTAYASVVDQTTNDALLVSPVEVSRIASQSWVIPGTADFRNDRNQWRSDLRIFNASNSAVLARVIFYPQDDPSRGRSVQVNVAPREVKVLDNVLERQFGITNVGGAIQVMTDNASSLVVTARTYDLASGGGTYGQFIPAVTTGFGVSDRAVHILQLEESARFRTNLGIVELTGKPVKVTVSVALPQSTTTPVINLDLDGHEFTQLVSVFRSMGLQNVYNARVSVKVVGGEGRISAYGSVVDNFTQDPTYVPGQ